MDVMQAIRTRRAIRSYRPDPVDKATLTELIGLAVCAPSGLNRQPWSFAVIEGRDHLASLETAARAAWLDDEAVLASQPPAVAQHVKELMEAGFPIFHGAPAAVLLLVPRGDQMALIDTAFAGQTLMLAAQGMGLATCPVALANAYLNLPSARADLGLPDDVEVMLTILIGTADGPWPDMPARQDPTIHWS